MKLFRYVGKKEIDVLLKNKVIYSDREHDAKTDSLGFCFFEYEGKCSIEYAYEFLSGIVDEYAIVVIDIEDDKVKEGYGTYADPYGGWFSTFEMDEYSIGSYSIDDVVGVYYETLDKMYDITNEIPRIIREKNKRINKKKHDIDLLQREIDRLVEFDKLENLEYNEDRIEHIIEFPPHIDVTSYGDSARVTTPGLTRDEIVLRVDRKNGTFDKMFGFLTKNETFKINNKYMVSVSNVSGVDAVSPYIITLSVLDVLEVSK